MSGPPEPLRVVPVMQDLGTRAGHRLVVLSVEMYDAWIDVRFARIDAGAERPLPRRVPPPDAWRVVDDAGEPVQVLDAVGRGDRAFSNGEVRLAPPAGSTERLHLEVVLVPGQPPLRGLLDLH